MGVKASDAGIHLRIGEVSAILPPEAADEIAQALVDAAREHRNGGALG